MRIFDRVRSKSHPLSSHLKDLLASSDEGQAEACNVMHDPRVSPAREGFFLSFIGAHDDETPFTEQVEDYFSNQIQQTDKPDFDDPCNENNEVDVPDEELASILNINGLWSMFPWAIEEFAKGN